MSAVSLNDVFNSFGPAPDSRTYVDRDHLDARLDTIMGSGGHIIIVGPSKHGKSTLCRRHFLPSETVSYTVTEGKTCEEIYRDLLSKLNARQKTGGGRSKSGNVKAGVPLGPVGISGEGTWEESETFTMEPGSPLGQLERQLVEKGYWCVIDDCHLLSDDEQRQLYGDLKVLADHNVPLVVVAAWPNESRLNRFGTNLLTRYHLIRLKWTPDELKRVLTEGQKALNIEFSQRIMDMLLESACGSVGILQNLSYDYCLACGLTERGRKRKVDDITALEHVRTNLYNAFRERYDSYARDAVTGFQLPNNPKVIPIYELLLAELFERATDDELLAGIPVTSLVHRLEDAYRKKHKVQLLVA